jgi:hypothetical protein
MAITCDKSNGQIDDDAQRQADELFQKILDSFIYAGETFIKSAREQVQNHDLGTYKDQTTNLRNSIQYFVFYNGELVHENTDGKNTNVSGSAGFGKQEIEDIIENEGFQLIGLAGMNYASHVESKGYNVISYQADVCIIDLTLFLENLEVIEQGSAAQTEESFIPDELPQGLRK